IQAVDLEKAPVEFYIVGSNCKQTLNAAVIYKDKERWKILFEGRGFRKQNGERVSGKTVEKFLYSSGDGVVSEESFLGGSKKPRKTRVHLECEAHDRLMSNRNVQNYILQRINAK
ncbi:MAG: hypothetical protein ACK419_04685, partial [Pyrinomonadaceae bacterium]